MPREERWREHKYKLHAPKSGHEHYVLEYKRKRKSGKYGKPETWKLKGKVPDWIFKWLVKRCTDLLKEIPNDKKTYHKDLPKIIDTLIRNGNAQGFKAKETSKDYGDVTWYLHGKPIATFLIADMSEHKQLWTSKKVVDELRKDKSDDGHRFRRMESKSKAPMRVAWAVSCHGKWFHLGVGKMRTRKGD